MARYSSMDEIPEEEIRRFMKKHYPEYADNIELGRILYWRWLRKQKKFSGGFGSPKYRRVNIADIAGMESGERVEIEGVVADTYHKEYEGCAVCKRRNCNNPEHHGRKLYVVDGLYIGDNTGVIWGSMIYAKEEEDNIPRVDIGYKVRVRGRVKFYKGNPELTIDEVEVLEEKSLGIEEAEKAGDTNTDEDYSVSPEVMEKIKKVDVSNVNVTVSDVINILRNIGKVKYKHFRIILDRFGIPFDTLKDKIQVFTDDDGVKWVRLRNE